MKVSQHYDPKYSKHAPDNIYSDLERSKKLKYDNQSNAIIAVINLNSWHNKRSYLKSTCVLSPIDVFCVDVTKLDASFLDTQFLKLDYQFPPLRSNCNI